MDKTFPNVDAAVADIPDGSSIAIAGFFSAGSPAQLIQALARQGAKNLTIICLTMGPGNPDIEQLVRNKQIKKAVSDYPFHRSVSKGAGSPFEQAVRAGEIELEIYPLGTFIEKIRAGGAGIAGFYVRVGVGTAIEKGKENRQFDGEDYLLELAIKPDYAFIFAHKGDTLGNLVFRKTAQNLNPEMAKSAKTTIAVVEYLVQPGQLSPDVIQLPGVYVKRIVQVGRSHYYPSAD
jgi:3-oxoacid CoA-transferase A subunit